MISAELPKVLGFCPALLTAGILSSTAGAQAANDDCANALVIPPQVSFQLHSTAGANADGSSSCGSGAPDIWYAMPVSFDGTLELSMCAWPPSSTLDPLLSVHSGCPGTTANELACSDGGLSCPGGAHLLMPVTRGQTYWIRATGANGTSGSYDLYADGPEAPIPINDDREFAIAIGPGHWTGDNLEASHVAGTSFCDSGQADVWYSYTPSTSGTVSVNTCNPSTDDTVLGVFAGSTLIGCSDDGCGGGKQYLSTVTWNAIAGVEYSISVREFLGGVIFFDLNVSGPPRMNDVCTGAIATDVGTRVLMLDGASADGISSCSPGVEPDVYYSFSAVTPGLLTVSTCGTHDYSGVDSGEDTLISIHAGCPATTLNEIVCNDNATLRCAEDRGAAADARASTMLAQGQRVIVRVTRAGPTTVSMAPILVDFGFEPGIPFCAGDGTASACPCGNPGLAGQGCANSANARGALLAAGGQPTVSSDTLTLRGSGMPANSTALYAQGTTQVAGGAGTVFGDGLRCVGGTVVRLGLRVSQGGASSFGAADGSGDRVSVLGMIPPAGGTRHYQLWYRDAAAYCTSSTFNLSNGLELVWIP